MFDPNRRAKYDDLKDEDRQFDLDQYAKTLYQDDRPTPQPKKTPAESNMETVIERLHALGWENDGNTMLNTFRISTQDAPVYGGIGGKLVTTGGRHRMKRGNYRVTIGKKSTCFYAARGVPDGRMVTIPTKNIDLVIQTESEFVNKK